MPHNASNDDADGDPDWLPTTGVDARTYEEYRFMTVDGSGLIYDLSGDAAWITSSVVQHLAAWA